MRVNVEQASKRLMWKGLLGPAVSPALVLADLGCLNNKVLQSPQTERGPISPGDCALDAWPAAPWGGVPKTVV